MVAMATRVRFRDVSISKIHHGGIFLHCAKFHAFMTKRTIFSHSAWTIMGKNVYISFLLVSKLARCPFGLKTSCFETTPKFARENLRMFDYAYISRYRTETPYF